MPVGHAEVGTHLACSFPPVTGMFAVTVTLTDMRGART
ncbi:hypothetical protein PAMC26510_14170 [Caballeronia sordidicola]|uniref:Uncharacterized protein n=1 Tax=Caballeronia sordidicola TaxID=196367 RepID=A0A242MWT9_CABSO|nr:hypothetical protein PAMC26577_26270 [Caballeronia sordidicola]OTP75584.1 hypothetical protein PAMC26510_14170 [Caballeronia sordidicola]